MLNNLLESQTFMLIATLTFLSGFYVALHFIKNKYNISAELSRKMVHIGLGLTTLSFPWLFTETWPIWLMCILSIASLLGLRHKKFKNNLGDALHGVDRTSYGEICFPLSVAILFQLSHDMPVYYIVSILVLTLADAFAALIGVRYGKSHYDAAEGIKSFEGSFFFFITAFLCVQIPLLLMSNFSNPVIILVSLFIALLITLCEAVSWQGLDNLFIPLGVYVILTHYLSFDALTLVMLSSILLGIILAGVYFKERSTMNLSAVLFSIVLGFLYVTLDPFSFVIPLSMMVLYAYISRKEHKELQNSHTVLTVFYLNLGGLFWAFLKSNGHTELTVEFSIYYCIQMGIISWIHQYAFYRKKNFIYPTVNSLILFTAIYMIYAGTFEIFRSIEYFHYMLYTVASLLVSLALFYLWSKKYDDIPKNRERLIIQGGTAFIGSIIFYILRGFLSWLNF